MRTGVLRRSVMLRSVVLMLTLALAGLVAACGSSANENVGGGPPPKVQCSQANTGHGVDVVNKKLTCQVANAASSDTSFTLHYAIKNDNGTPRTFDATCEGSLKNGVGTCTQTYALVVPGDLGTPSVSGEFLPSHRAIGPIAPTGDQ